MRPSIIQRPEAERPLLSNPSPSQPLAALDQANSVRRRRADLKRRIGTGELSAAEVILDPPGEASSWPVVELLASQRGWGSAKSRRLLARLRISELRSTCELTERQRRLLVGELERGGSSVRARGTPRG